VYKGVYLKTVIQPVLLYEVETWLLTNSLSERFSVCEMRMLPYHLGINFEEHKTRSKVRKEKMN